jgi:hypothetical protein
MKKTSFFILIVLLTQLSFSQTLIVHKKDQTTITFPLSQVDSITFSLPTSPGGYTGNFLAWTGSSDPAHYFTLVRVNGQNGTVTNIGGNDFFGAMAYGPDGTLYGVSDDLHIINPNDGSTIKIGDFNYQGQAKILMRGAALSPNGTLYVEENSSPNRIFSLNLSNAALTYIGTPTALIWDLEFASNGTLYGAFADLFTLNPSNMSTISTVGSTGVYIGPLTLGNEGTLFGMDLYPSTNIYSLNLSTGHATSITMVGSTGLNSCVAERTTVSKEITQFSIAAKTYGFAPQRTKEELLALEKAVKQSYTARFKNAK